MISKKLNGHVTQGIVIKNRAELASILPSITFNILKVSFEWHGGKPLC